MIGYLSGVARAGGIVLDGAGVGWAVSTPFILTPGEPVELFIVTVVRQDAIILYGFDSTDSRDLFTALTKVTGVGPSMALSVLAHLSPAELVTAVQGKDAKALSKVRGVGVKVAERIVTLMQVPQGLSLEGLSSVSSKVSDVDDVAWALVSLGWSESVAVAAVTKARAALAPDADDGLVLKLALRS